MCGKDIHKDTRSERTIRGDTCVAIAWASVRFALLVSDRTPRRALPT